MQAVCTQKHHRRANCIHDKGWSSRARGQRSGSGRDHAGARSLYACDLQHKCESHTHTNQTSRTKLARDGTVVPPTEIGTSTQRDFTHLRRICDLKGGAGEIRAVGVGAGCAEHDRCKKIRAPLGRTRTCSICRQRSYCASGDCAFIERHTPARLRDLQFAFKFST